MAYKFNPFTGTFDIVPDTATSTSGYKLYHGFVALSGSSLSFESSTRVFSLTYSSDYDVYHNGIKTTLTATKTTTIGTGVGQHYIWMKTDGTLDNSQTPWDILDTTVIPVATIVWDGASAPPPADERHDYRRNLLEHKRVHSTQGASYVSGFTPNPTFLANNTFSFSGGVFCDEDLFHTLTGSQTQCFVSYRATTTDHMKFDSAGTGFAKLNGAVPRYDNAGVLTDIDIAKFGIQWMYAVNFSGNVKLVSVLGQGQYNTVALAQSASQPTLSGITVAEWKLLYRVIIKNVGSVLTVTQTDVMYNLSTGPAIQAGSPTTVSAGNVTFNPSGNIAASNVQTALEELDSEKLPISGGTLTGNTIVNVGTDYTTARLRNAKLMTSVPVAGDFDGNGSLVFIYTA